MYKRFVSLEELNYDRAINKATGKLEGIDEPIPKGTVFTTISPFEGTVSDSEDIGRFWTVEFNKSDKTYTITINERDLKTNDDFPGVEPPQPAKFRGETEGGRKKRRRTGRRSKSSRRKSRRNKK